MASTHVLEVTDSSFQSKVLESDKPILVDFSAEWCPPCKIMAPMIDEIALEYAGKVKVGKVDVDGNQQSAAKYAIDSIPTLIIFNKGQIVRKIVGLTPKKTIKEALDTVAPVK